ncbi:MAG: TonB-dependent receptor [Pseudomonadales bacterium]|nr:TonB-dependent receptor [Pseudomonadales bacterium]
MSTALKTTYFLCILTLSFSASMSSASNNDDINVYALPIEELLKLDVVTASKREQSITDAAAIISVINREDILHYGANNLVELLRHFPGFLPVQDVTYGERSIALRGDSEVNHVLTMVDGVPYRSMISAVISTRILFKTFPLQMIERIELIRGPGSVLYGTNAVTGVINIITRNAETDDVASSKQLEASYTHGELETQVATIYSQYTHDDLHLSLAVTDFKEEGWKSNFLAPVINNLVPFTYNNSENYTSIFATASLANWQVKTYLTDYTANSPILPQAISDNDLLSEHRFIEVNYQFNVQGWQGKTNLTYLHINDAPELATEKNIYWELNLQKPLSDQWHWLIGTSVNQIDVDTKTKSLDNVEKDLYSLYSQLDWAASDQLTLTAGGQINKVKDSDDNFVPRIAAIYHLNDVHGFKLLYSEAFRSPTVTNTDVEISFPGVGVVFSGNPDLKAETVKTWDWQWFANGDNYFYAVTLFDSQYENLINVDPGNIFAGQPGSFVQQGELNTYGLELEGYWNLDQQWSFKAAYTWQHNEDEEGLENVSLTPRWSMNLGLVYAWQKHHISLFNQHISAFFKKDVPADNPNADAYNMLNLEARFSLASLLSIPAEKDLALSVYFNNLLDEKIYQPEYVFDQPNTIPAASGRAGYVTIELTL